MASRTIYITVRLEIENNKQDEITSDEVQDIVNEIDYDFQNVGDFIVQSEICGIND
ncbi:MAG: hypothetical protein SNI81_07950 [Rikenellaceae bacterium]